MPYLKKGASVPTKGKGSKLSPKMLVFIDEFMVHMNATKAYEAAGYKNNNPNRGAAELRNHPLVSAEIDRRMQEKRERNELSADYVINKLIDIVDSTDRSNPSAALRGLELLGKHLGLYKDRQEISGPDGEAIRMEQKVHQDAADFASRMARLAASGGTGSVSELPKPRSEGET